MENKNKASEKLFKQLNDIAKKAYVPYSHFRVVALFENKDKTFFSGVNIENAAYPNTMCAERVAIHSAINNGINTKNVKIVHIYSPDAKDFLAPCGGCRQTMGELINYDCMIRMYNKNGEYISKKMSQVFPFVVTKENIKGKN